MVDKRFGMAGLALAVSGCVLISGGDELREGPAAASSNASSASNGGSGGDSSSSSVGGMTSVGGMGGSTASNGGGGSAGCSDDSSCGVDRYCESGTCVSQKDNGSACGTDGEGEPGAECISGHCADGVCCDTACSGECQACVASKSGKINGVCGAIGEGQDPDGECLADAASCRAGGCNGDANAPACSPASAGAICRPRAGACDINDVCDGVVAACPVDAVVAEGIASGCDLLVCDGTSPKCPTMCGPQQGTCQGAAQCVSGACKVGRLIVAGGKHTCARTINGNVRCWGRNDKGQLGYGNVNPVGDDETPASAGNVNVGGSVIQLAVGGLHTCALLDTGKVRCWGDNAAGQLGYGNKFNIGDDEVPAAAGDVDLGGPAVKVSAGFAHTCALLANGNLRCWGYGLNGRLGYGNTAIIGDDETPASAGDVPVGGKVIDVAGGKEHTCAIVQSGAVVCWGRNHYGQLGYGNKNDIGDDELPMSAGTVSLGGTVVQIAASNFAHTCALMSDGKVRCWGRGGGGPLGLSSSVDIGDDELPSTVAAVDVGIAAVELGVGAYHTCVRSLAGAVHCWGQGIYGLLGYGNTNNIGDNENPSSAGAVQLSSPSVSLSVGETHTCSLGQDGKVQCWGEGLDGKLGYGNVDDVGDDETPMSVGTVSVE